jgi:hypothetical protein
MLRGEDTRMLRLCISLLVAFALTSLLADSGASKLHVIRGIVTEWQPGHSISVANEQTDPGGVRVTLRDTVYSGNPSAIRPGVRATVWVKRVGERLRWQLK